MISVVCESQKFGAYQNQRSRFSGSLLVHEDYFQLEAVRNLAPAHIPEGAATRNTVFVPLFELPSLGGAAPQSIDLLPRLTNLGTSPRRPPYLSQ